MAGGEDDDPGSVPGCPKRTSGGGAGSVSVGGVCAGGVSTDNLALNWDKLVFSFTKPLKYENFFGHSPFGFAIFIFWPNIGFSIGIEGGG